MKKLSLKRICFALVPALLVAGVLVGMNYRSKLNTGEDLGIVQQIGEYSR